MQNKETAVLSDFIHKQIEQQIQDRFKTPLTNRNSRINTQSNNSKNQKLSDLKIQVNSRKAEQFKKMAKIFKSTYKKKVLQLQEIRESQQNLFEEKKFDQQEIDTAQIQAEQIFNEIFVTDHSQYLYIGQVPLNTLTKSKIEVYGMQKLENNQEIYGDSQSEEEQHYVHDFKVKNYYLTPDQMESLILEKMQDEEKNYVSFLKYLQKRHNAWTDQKIIKISQSRVSQIVDAYFTDEDMNNVELPDDEMTEEPLQYLVDTFELKKKLFQHIFIEQFVIQILKELILNVNQEKIDLSKLDIKQKLNKIFECANQKIESLQLKRQNMLKTQVFKEQIAFQNQNIKYTQLKNQNLQDKKLSSQMNERSFESGILNINKQNTNMKQYILNQILNSNEFLIIAEDDCIYNYEQLPKDSQILQKCSDTMDEKEFRQLASTIQKMIYKSNHQKQQIDTQMTDLILLQFLHSLQQSSLKLQEKDSQISQYQQNYQLILQRNDYLNEKINQEMSLNQENQVLISNQEKQLKHHGKYQNEQYCLNIDLLIKNKKHQQNKNQEILNDLQIIKAKYMEQDNIIYELKKKCEQIEEEKQQLQEELEQQNQHFFQILKNHQSVSKELLFCKDLNMHLQNQLAQLQENMNDGSCQIQSYDGSYKSQSDYGSYSDDEVVRVNSNQQSDEEFPQTKEFIGEQQISTYVGNRNGDFYSQDIEDADKIDMTLTIYEKSQSPKKESEQENNSKVLKEK